MNSEDFIRIAEYIKENYVSKEEWENDLVAHTFPLCIVPQWAGKIHGRFNCWH